MTNKQTAFLFALKTKICNFLKDGELRRVRHQGPPSNMIYNNGMTEIAPELWDHIQCSTMQQMIEHTGRYFTPISRALSHEEGRLLGTGSYCEFAGRNYLITNEHVAREMQNYPLTHQFFKNDHVIRIMQPFFSFRYPADVAMSRIEDAAWHVGGAHEGQAIPASRFCLKHQPAEHELLFFAGFSGERSGFIFDSLITPGTPYVTQECKVPDEIGDPMFHFALFYRPALAHGVDDNSNSRGLPLPPGLSGSLVWDTKRVACLQQSKQWKPEYAKVTGIVWGWPSSRDGCVVATKVEHMRIGDIIEVYDKHA